MTNAVILPLEAEMELVITADNSGTIGEKAADNVKAPNQVVGKFACRVALMECLAAYAEPRTIVMQNFTDDSAWHEYKAGVDDVLAEAGFINLPVTGSTESNFSSMQSALGLTIVGTRKKRAVYEWTGNESFAVIGKPFVGQEVLDNIERIPSVLLLKEFTETTGVKAIAPVGSKGIAETFYKWTGRKVKLECDLNLDITAGPATCFIIAFDSEKSTEVIKLGGENFHILQTSD